MYELYKQFINFIKLMHSSYQPAAQGGRGPSALLQRIERGSGDFFAIAAALAHRICWAFQSLDRGW